MATVTKYPNSITSEQVEKDQWGTETETAWNSLSNLKADDNNDAVTDTITAGTKSKPGRIKAYNYGFTFKDNTRINKIIVYWEEYIRNTSGGTNSPPNIPSKSLKLLNANNGYDTAYRVHGANVPTSRTARALEFPLSVMPYVKNANIESSSFGVYFNPARNNNGNLGKMYMDYLRVLVDYTDPTYSLAADISTGKVVGEQVTYTLTLKNTNNCHQGVNIPISVTLPAGLTVASQSGNGTYNTNTKKWTAILNSQKIAVLKLVLNTGSEGTKTITASVDGFSTSLSKSTVVLPPSYTLTTPNSKDIVQETKNLTYTVTVTVNTTAISSVNVNIPVPVGMSFVSATGAGTYNNGTGVWNAVFTNKTASMTFTWLATTSGVRNQIMSVGSASFTKEITILPANLTVPYWTDYNLPADVLNYLQDGKTYTLSCWSVVTDTVLTYVYGGDYNFTISIINGTEYLSDKATALNTPTRISTTFIYNQNEPIKLRVYGQWLEINPQNSSHEVGGFALYPGTEKGYELPALMFNNPARLILDGEYAETTLSPGRIGSGVLLSTLELGGIETDEELIIKGLTITGDINLLNDVGLNVVLNNGSETSNRSIIITAGAESFNIGGERDKWGLNKLNLEDLSFKLSLSNITSSNTLVKLRNIAVQLTYIYDQTQGNPGFTLNGVHSKEYNIFLSPGWEKPDALNTDLQGLKLTRSDGEKIISSTVTSKEFKIKFQILADSLEDANTNLTEIAGWMSNKRDKNQKPIPQAMVFDWDREREFNVILNDSISPNFSVGNFEVVAKFLVPDGVGWSNMRQTGATGRNTGLIGVRPVLTILCTGSNQIFIQDDVSNQYLKITHTFEADTILTVDCQNRTIQDDDGNNYVQYISIDSYWFKIGENTDYDFTESLGCVVQQVKYREAL